MKVAALLPLLTAGCRGYAEDPPPTSWLDLVNRYLPYLIFTLLLWALNK